MAKQLRTETKILSPEAASRLRNRARRMKEKVVFTNGCFDLLHAGHVAYLEAARRRGDLLIVGINSDSSVRRLKGAQRPIQRQRHRARVLAALEAVDAVVVFSGDTPRSIIERLKPDVLVKGADWPLAKIVGGTEVMQAGGRVVRIRLKRGQSTSAIIEKIASSHGRAR